MNAPDNQLIEQLAAAVAQHMKRAIPLAVDLWSAAEIAAYLKLSPGAVLERYAPLPSFPDAIRLPTTSGGRGQPRWKAAEVIAWAEKHKDGAGTRRTKAA